MITMIQPYTLYNADPAPSEISFARTAIAVIAQTIPQKRTIGNQWSHAKSVKIRKDGVSHDPFHFVGAGRAPNIHKIKRVITIPMSDARPRVDFGSNPVSPL
jgi:hypothetical protein